MEYFPWYFIEKVHKRLLNGSENPNEDDVLKNTLDKYVSFEFISDYPKNYAYGLETITNTPTCWLQIFKVLKTLEIEFFDQF